MPNPPAAVVVVYTSCKDCYPLQITVHKHTSSPNLREMRYDHFKGAVWYYHSQSKFMISWNNEIQQISKSK